MAKIRAYRLADELGIEKAEFLDKVREMGIELRGPMSGLDEEQAASVRAKLGAKIIEERVERRAAGGTVIRRRRKVVEAEPESAPLEAAEPEVSAEEPAVAEVAEPAVPEPVLGEPVIPAEPEPRPAPAPVEAREMDVSSRIAPVERGLAGRGEPPGHVAAKRPVRRTHNEQVKLKEQEGLARTMMGNVQHRLEQRRLIVEQQARQQRRRTKTKRKLTLRAVGPKKKIIRVAGDASFKEIAAQTGVKVRDLVRRARTLGVEIDRDDRVDFDTVGVIAEELGYQVQQTTRDVEESVAAVAQSRPEDLEPRPPVVTVMGHVDHGKTSLLDTIRKTNVVAGEAGGITQHIGAYRVATPAGEITFLDTPGHEAFTQMRARGAQATDVVVLVVAADDGIMPQTVEAIDHAKAAKVPIIVAINKMDRPDADSTRVRNELLQHELVVEELGGDILAVEVSATEKTNLDKLEEAIVLQAELLELKANSDRTAEGVVVEARLERGRGPVSTVLVQRGTLKVGDIVVAGSEYGRVRAMNSDTGAKIETAGPSSPVEIIGLGGAPGAGDEFAVVDNEARARELTEFRERRARDERTAITSRGTLETMFDQIGSGASQELAILIKADAQGSIEAIQNSAQLISTDEVSVRVLHSGVGGVNESDVTLAKASNAMIVAFNVRANPQARELLARDRVDIRYYSIIYEVIDDMKTMLSGMLAPLQRENFLGNAKILEVFNITKVGRIAGCKVTDGMVKRGASVRLLRDDIVIHQGSLSTLKRFKDEVREVRDGFECGMAFENYRDLKVDDVIECFEVEEVARTR